MEHDKTTVLWSQLLTGNQASFARLMQLYYAELFKYGCSLNGDDDVVKDCIQNVFLHIWRTRHNLKAVEHVKFYLLKSLRNEIFKETIRDKTETDNRELFSRTLEATQSTREDVMISREEEAALAHRVSEVMVSLSPRQQEIIYLRYYMDMKPEQIAEIIGINRQSVYNLLSDALKRLKDKL